MQFRWKRNLNRRKQFFISCFRRNERNIRFTLHHLISNDPDIDIVVKSREKRIEEEKNYLGKKEQCSRTDTADIYEKKKKKKFRLEQRYSFDFFQWPLIFETVLHDSSSRLREVWLKSINSYKNVIQLWTNFFFFLNLICKETKLIYSVDYI